MTTRVNARPLAVAAFFAAILTAVIVDAASSDAAAAGLFDPATPAEARSVPPRTASGGTMRDGLRGTDDVNLRERIVTLNTTELSRLVPLNADDAGDRLDRAGKLGRSVTLDLFPGVSVTVPRIDVEAPDEGGFIWSGEVGGMRAAFVTLVIKNNEVYGQIQTGGKLYSIEPAAGRLHRIIEIDQSKIRNDLHPPEVPEMKGEGDEAPEPRAGSTTIRVIVANTISARNECRNGGTAAQKQACMQARINLAIKLANQAANRSGVKIVFQRVGGQLEYNYPDTTLYGANNYVGVLCDISGFNNSGACGGVGNNKAAVFNTLRSKRNQTKADLVVLMRKQGTACGVAWVPNLNGTVKKTTHIYGFSVVTSSPSYGCIEGNTFAHETGHNQGMNHDRIQHVKDYGGSMPPASQFNFGHVNRTKKFFTIMSYQQSCGNGCTRIPYFSNPKVKYQGTPTGVVPGTAGQFGAADAARLLNKNRAIIGTYR